MVTTLLSTLAATGRLVTNLTGTVRDQLCYFLTQKYTDVVASKLVRKL
jgi:hypothetical protein